MNQVWIIVYPGGDMTKLTLALAWDYEFDEYCRASRKEWSYEQEDEAIRYGRDLAKENRLEAVGKLYSQEDKFLD
jgi:hypothetical protein